MIALRRSTHAPQSGRRAGSRPLYAIGDIHGCYDLLRALLAEVRRDASERHPGETPVLVFCGDYVDRGPASAQVMAAMVWLARSGVVEARLLEGNHEAVLRLFLEEPEEHRPWLDFGGRETLESYGVSVPDTIEPGMLTHLRDALTDVMPVSHHQLLGRLETMVRIGDYVFVHAGVRPGVALDRQERDDLLWIREEFIDHPKPANRPIVHGHTWENERPIISSHRIGIDTGAYETGVLTALRLADDELEVIQAVREG